MNYQELIDYEAVGDSHHDGHFLIEGDRFVADETNPIGQRAAVVRKQSVVYGYSVAEDLDIDESQVGDDDLVVKRALEEMG